MKKLFIAALFFTLGFANTANAQQDSIAQNTIVRNVMYQPTDIDNYSYVVFYLADGKIYSLTNSELSNTLDKVSKIAINPGGAACAALITDVKKQSRNLPVIEYLKDPKTRTRIEILDAFDDNKTLGQIKGDVNMTTMAYSPDGKSLAVGYIDSTIYIYDTKTHILRGMLSPNIIPMKISVSENNYFAAVACNNTVEIWNMQDNSLRKSFNMSSEVTSVAFSANNEMMAISSANGEVKVYNTTSFSEKHNFTNMGEAISCNFHPNNKYLGVVTSSSNIVMQNLMNESDKIDINTTNQGISTINYVIDLMEPEKVYMLYYTGAKEIVFYELNNLQPNRTELLASRVNLKMSEWVKMMDGETMDEYKLRVNDETRALKQLTFEREIATEMAGDILATEKVTLGTYSSEKNLLSLNFSGVSSIVLEVPQEEVVDFNNPSQLSFSNTVYGLNSDDQFDVIYTEVLNLSTGKKYVYNNLERKSSLALNLDEGFVPIELIQQSGLEEVKLKEIRKQVVESAKKDNLISDNTNINVSTEVVKDVDASGKSIMNYKVNYSYQVEKEFTAKEDFKPGHYKTEESNAAMSMLKIIKQAFSSDFAQYIKAGKRLRIKITGSADAAPIRSVLPYDDCYGSFNNELIYQNGILSNVTVNKTTGVEKNEQLAFLRAVGLKHHISNEINSLKDMECEYIYNIELSNKTGGEYRRINVEFLFVDAF